MWKSYRAGEQSSIFYPTLNRSPLHDSFNTYFLISSFAPVPVWVLGTEGGGKVLGTLELALQHGKTDKQVNGRE